nr:hypothetical protein [Methylobacterium sp. ZNC0032]
MSAGWVNLMALMAMLLIIASAVAIFFVGATRRGGRKQGGLAKPSQAHHRQVNPKTGDLFR